MIGTKIDSDKCRSAVGLVEGTFFFRAFPLKGRVGKDIQRLVRSRSRFGNELVRGTGEGRGRNSSVVPKESFLKREGKVCALSIYPILLYRVSLLPLPYAILMILVRFLFFFLWGGMLLPSSSEDMLPLPFRTRSGYAKH